MIGNVFLRARLLGIVIGSTLAATAVGAIISAAPAHAMALILVDATTGKVLRAENATYPWYPASTTKLMTLYMTLSAMRDGRITPDTLVHGLAERPRPGAGQDGSADRHAAHRR